MEIRYVDSWIANNYGNYIELNKHLKEYPELHDALLNHELSHTNKTFSKKDFFLDFGSSGKINQFQLLKFMINHPRAFKQLLPFCIKDKIFYFDINMIIMWGLFFTFIGIGVFFAL